MRANRNYWSTTATPLTINFAGTAITVANGDATLTTPFDCTKGGANAPCTVGHLAAFDLQQWVADLNLVLPNVSGTINCPTPVTGPTGCTIQLSWNESNVAVNGTAAGNSMVSMVLRKYTLYVEP